MSWRVLVIVVMAATSLVFGQDEDRTKWEVGALLAILDLRGPVAEKPLGFGLRFGHNFNRWGTLETEYVWYPHNTQGDFGQRQFLSGLKAGVRGEDYGGFLKLRPGLVHLGGDSFRVYHGRSETLPAVDIGGGFERYLSSNVLLRADFGDTMVFFGNKTIRTGLDTRHPGLAHCPQFNLGLAITF